MGSTIFFRTKKNLLKNLWVNKILGSKIFEPISLRPKYLFWPRNFGLIFCSCSIVQNNRKLIHRILFFYCHKILNAQICIVCVLLNSFAGSDRVPHIPSTGIVFFYLMFWWQFKSLKTFSSLYPNVLVKGNHQLIFFYIQLLKQLNKFKEDEEQKWSVW